MLIGFLTSLAAGVVAGLIVRAIPETALRAIWASPLAVLKRIQQVWRGHRATIIASVAAVGNLPVEFWREQRRTVVASFLGLLTFVVAVVSAVVAVSLPGGDTPPPPPPTEQQEQALEAPTTPPPPPTGKREALARALFGGENGLEQGVRLNPHDHLYGAEDPDPQADPENPVCNGYQGGHAGWHVRAEQVTGGQPNDNLVFHSLTAGTVARVNGSGTYNEISVYRKPEGDARGHMIIYAHAREVLVTEGDPIDVGHELGVQGRSGLADPAEEAHVHIEVREDGPDGTRRTRLACGKTPTNGAPGPIDPVEYLYRAWIDDRER